MLFHDLAVAARAAGDAAEALRAEQAALALDKDNPAALNGLGLVHVDAGRTGRCRGRLRACRQRRSARTPPTGRTSGMPAGSWEISAAAETAYRRALEVDASYADALNGLGVLLVQRGPAAEAIPAPHARGRDVRRTSTKPG